MSLLFTGRIESIEWDKDGQSVAILQVCYDILTFVNLYIYRKIIHQWLFGLLLPKTTMTLSFQLEQAQKKKEAG